jgi:hypothetical protein
MFYGCWFNYPNFAVNEQSFNNGCNSSITKLSLQHTKKVLVLPEYFTQDTLPVSKQRFLNSFFVISFSIRGYECTSLLYQ